MIGNKVRNFGIDLLRIVVMYFVVILHVCNYGGAGAAATTIYQQGVCCIYKSITCIAVNVFAIISGYVGYGSTKLKISRLLELWLMVVFYGVVISIVMLFCGTENVGYSEIIKAFLPVTLNKYWYFSAYAGLFFLTPILNKLIDTLTEAYFVRSAIVAALVFSVYGVFASYFSDPFALQSGYSLFWLMVLYYFGAGIKRFDIGGKTPAPKLAVSILAVWAINASLAIALAYATELLQSRFFRDLTDYLILSYISPAALLLSVLVFLLFSKWTVKLPCRKLLTTCSASAFAVYIIHTNPLIWEHWFKDAFCFIATYSSLEMLFYIPVVALAVFLLCMGIDILRAKLFSLIGVRAFFQKAEAIVSERFEKTKSVLS